jgi:2-methylcitrate dehydratase PrpD
MIETPRSQLTSERLVDHALSVDWSALSASVRADALRLLYDAVVVGIGGARATHGDELLHVVQGWGAAVDQSCGVLGRPGVRLPAPSAAFINAFQTHGQEFDSVHEGAVLHPLPTIMPVLMAEAERSGPYPGSEILAAMIAGTDVSVTLGVAATSPIQFFRPATAGVFGSVAALCRLRRLDRETTLNALGYALAFSSGTMQAHTEGKPALPVQVANAARSAIQAVDIAVAGVPGPIDSITGPFGYLTLFEKSHDLSDALDRLGRDFRISEVCVKPYPSGRATHGGVVAALNLRQAHGLNGDQVVGGTYRAPALIRHLVGRESQPGMAVSHARLCLPYLIAVALTRGAVGLSDFTPTALSDAAVLDLASRIVVTVDDNPDPAAFIPAELTLTLKDGRTVHEPVKAQLGSPAFPLSREQQLAKGYACLDFAGLSALHEPLAALMDRFDTLTDGAEAFRLGQGAT